MNTKLNKPAIDFGYNLFNPHKDEGNCSRFAVIGSRLKKQKVEENYGVLF